MSPDQLRKAIHATVRGNVQGVGFRYRTMWAADAEGVTGWVRNEPDGSVEIHAEGTPHRVDRFLKILRGGFPGVVVSRIETITSEPHDYTEFRVEY